MFPTLFNILAQYSLPLPISSLSQFSSFFSNAGNGWRSGWKGRKWMEMSSTPPSCSLRHCFSCLHGVSSYINNKVLIPCDCLHGFMYYPIQTCTCATPPKQTNIIIYVQHYLLFMFNIVILWAANILNNNFIFS